MRLISTIIDTSMGKEKNKFAQNKGSCPFPKEEEQEKPYPPEHLGQFR